jgi:hypothetical protein
MTKLRCYEVLWYREDDLEQDYVDDVENDEQAIAQLTAEIQQAFDGEVGLTGFFKIVKRSQVEKIGD